MATVMNMIMVGFNDIIDLLVKSLGFKQNAKLESTVFLY